MVHWTQSNERQPRIAIIGAGMSGIAAVVKLRKAGYRKLAVYEKAEQVGGTWRANRYPGLSCDVPSHWYSFTFNPNPDWTHRFSYGPEIQAYMQATADKFDVTPLVQFNTGVRALAYDEKGEDGPVWHLTTEHGDEEIYDIVISATGILRLPQLPDIRGLDGFTGTKFHSADWPDNLDLSGKRVGIIGTGSTSCQIVGEITDKVGTMHVFQRTPHWVAPLPQKKYAGWQKFFMRALPFLPKLTYWINYLKFRATFAPATSGQSPFWLKRFDQACRDHLDEEIADPDLRAKLTPDFTPMCKRLIFASDYFPALQKDNCQLITEGIERIDGDSLITKDGARHELDVLVLATGFDPSAFILPTRVTGKDGKDLGEFWGRAPRAHRGVTLPGFPNFWMIEGPTSPVGNLSLIMISEHQIDYIISMLDNMRKSSLQALAPKRKAYEDYNADLAKAAKNTVWVTGGCDSWYIDASGLPNLYSHEPQRYLRDMHALDLQEYEMSPRVNRLAAE